MVSFNGHLTTISSDNALWVKRLPEYIPVPPLVCGDGEVCIAVGENDLFLIDLKEGSILEQIPHSVPAPRLATISGRKLLIYSGGGQVVSIPMSII